MGRGNGFHDLFEAVRRFLRNQKMKSRRALYDATVLAIQKEIDRYEAAPPSKFKNGETGRQERLGSLRNGLEKTRRDYSDVV